MVVHIKKSITRKKVDFIYKLDCKFCLRREIEKNEVKQTKNPVKISGDNGRPTIFNLRTGVTAYATKQNINNRKLIFCLGLLILACI